jgi:ribosomal protein S18 acetylase RimI-like enzyme
MGAVVICDESLARPPPDLPISRQGRNRSDRDENMPAAIHHITEANTALLARVDPDVFDHAIVATRVAAYVADPLHAMFVAVDDGVVVGHIRGCVHLQPDRASDLYVDNLGTAPSHQRRGIAAQLMRALLAWGEAQGCTYAWVATETDNEQAKGFYDAQNFERGTIAMFSQELD